MWGYPPPDRRSFSGGDQHLVCHKYFLFDPFSLFRSSRLGVAAYFLPMSSSVLLLHATTLMLARLSRDQTQKSSEKFLQNSPNPSNSSHDFASAKCLLPTRV